MYFVAMTNDMFSNHAQDTKIKCNAHRLSSRQSNILKINEEDDAICGNENPAVLR